MSWWQWVIVIWLSCAAVITLALIRAQAHAPRDPADECEDFVPEAWSWPSREDESTVRHGGLGR